MLHNTLISVSVNYQNAYICVYIHLMEDLFRARLRQAISESGLLMKELASEAGVSRRTLEGWVGKRGSLPSVLDFYKVAKVLDRSVEWFFSANPASVSVPERLKAVIPEIAMLSDDDLETVSVLVNSLLLKQQKKRSSSIDGTISSAV